MYLCERIAESSTSKKPVKILSMKKQEENKRSVF